MFNIHQHYAAGGTVYLAYETAYNDFRLGARMRLRRWINSDLSLNLTSGLLFFGGSTCERHPEFTGQLDLSYKDWLIPYVGVDVLRTTCSPRIDGPNWTLGGRVGGTPGGVGMAIAGGVIAVMLIAFAVAG
jgi:hypothetical protein